MIYNGRLIAYAEAKAVRDSLDADCKRYSALLDAYPKSAIGLTSDASKTDPEWRAAYQGSVRTFAALRRFNTGFVKAFKHEITAERAVKYGRAAQ